MAQNNDKEINFELNLLPVISLLAVCISFLLLTATWIQIGTLDIKQAVGQGGGKEGAEQALTIWAEIQNQNISVVLKKGHEKTIKKFSAVHLKNFEKLMENISQQYPDLATAVILPTQKASYEHVIAVLDQMKKHKIIDVGISPL